MSKVIDTAKAFPLYSIVEITTPLNPLKGWYLWHSPFKDTGVIAQVTGYHGSGDLVLNGNQEHSVSPNRVTLLNAELYSITDKMTEDLGGTLSTMAPGERFIVVKDKARRSYSDVIKYLDRAQDHLHYTGGKWIDSLIRQGAIVKGLYSQEVIPEEFNSVFDAPIGMVLAYMVKGELAVGAMYPYLMRSNRGVWVYCSGSEPTICGKWRFLTAGKTREENMPYLHDLQRCWQNKAAFVEVFDYPSQQKGGLAELRNELIEESNNA